MKDLKNLKGKKREGRTAACVLSDGGPFDTLDKLNTGRLRMA